MKKKPVSLVAVILIGIASAIWIACAVLSIVNKTYRQSTFLFVMYVLCGVIWPINFFLNLRRYRNEKAKDASKTGPNS